MEEKKLTDEVIVKALENCINGYTDMNRHSCDTCPYSEIDPCGKTQMIDILDLIHRLQNEVSQWKSKAEHIEEVYDADREHFIRTTTEQKAEIEQLTEVRNDFLQEVITLNNEKRELQKQVDELKAELEKAYETERANIKAEIADAGTSCHWCEQQTVKDTANKVYKGLCEQKNWNDMKEAIRWGDESEELKALISKIIGVEVE